MARSAIEIERIAQSTVAALRTRIPVEKAYLFGSYAEGRPHEDSDIDIAAFSPAADTMTYSERVALTIEVERQIDAPIELHLFGTKSLGDARATNFFGYLQSHGKYIV